MFWSILSVLSLSIFCTKLKISSPISYCPITKVISTRQPTSSSPLGTNFRHLNSTFSQNQGFLMEQRIAKREYCCRPCREFTRQTELMTLVLNCQSWTFPSYWETCVLLATVLNTATISLICSGVLTFWDQQRTYSMPPLPRSSGMYVVFISFSLPKSSPVSISFLLSKKLYSSSSISLSSCSFLGASLGASFSAWFFFLNKLLIMPYAPLVVILAPTAIPTILLTNIAIYIQYYQPQSLQSLIIISQLQSMHEQHYPSDQDTQPFIIEVFNKEDRQRERESRPKLGLRRLTQDKKLVSIDIDIPVDENTVIKDKFDWDLSKDKLSPTDFARELVASLALSAEYAEKMKEQILSQIMQHIKTHTKQKTPEEREMLDDQLYNRGYQPIRFNNEYAEEELDKEENEKKKMSRMRRNDMKRTTVVNPAQPNRYFKEKKICRNCKNENITPGYECKICKMPFQLMQLLNFEDRRVKISVKYYQKIANKIPLLTYQAKKRHFEKEDFDSFYAIYNKIKSIFENSDELSKENLNQVKYIMQKYHEYFLKGQLDFNDEELIYDKDMKKEAKEEDSNRPKRQRGRPRKIKIINDDLIPNSDNNDDDSSSQSDSDVSSESDFTS